jgi:hypothetical protein
MGYSFLSCLSPSGPLTHMLLSSPSYVGCYRRSESPVMRGSIMVLKVPTCRGGWSSSSRQVGGSLVRVSTGDHQEPFALPPRAREMAEAVPRPGSVGRSLSAVRRPMGAPRHVEWQLYDSTTLRTVCQSLGQAKKDSSQEQWMIVPLRK